MSDEPGVGVLGGGAWGTALAAMLATRDGESLLWARDDKTVRDINENHRNQSYLGDISLPVGLKATSELDLVCDREILLCVTPAQGFADLSVRLAPLITPDTQIVLCAKGIDQSSGRLLHQIAGERFGASHIGALSGPSFAHDVARCLPTAVSCAASSAQQADQLAGRLSSASFRVYGTDDLLGVEVGGALKNVLALAVGITRGLGLGASAEAALIARGFAELRRLAVALGARAETLSGLSGLGDLVLTCSSPQSRNFAYGMALGRGDDLAAMKLAEGVHSAAQALKIARAHHVEAPIIEAVVAVLENNLSPRAAAQSLLSRPLRSETSS